MDDVAIIFWVLLPDVSVEMRTIGVLVWVDLVPSTVAAQKINMIYQILEKLVEASSNSMIDKMQLTSMY